MTASIAHAPFVTAPATRRVIAALEAARPGGSRFVGGCVRNALLGRPVDDVDIATQLAPEAVMAAARAAGIQAVPTGLEHGTVTLVAESTPFEVTTLRRDVETDGRRAVVAFTEHWAEDAARRDFRMNALYADPDGTVFDPTGEGLADARAGRVIFIGDAETRIREDYLRILRFFRFSAWYGRGLDPAGLAACARLTTGLASLSVERIWKELKKLLAAEDPRAALAAMGEAGVLAGVLPEGRGLDRLGRLVETDLVHLFPADPLLRIAALLPDEPALAAALAGRLKLSTAEGERLAAALDPSERIVSYLSLRELRRALYRIGLQAVLDRARLAWAGSEAGRTDAQWRGLIALAQGWTRPKLPLTGEEVIAAGVRPGPRVGVVMREVEAWWIDADFTDDKLSLVERLKAVAQALG